MRIGSVPVAAVRPRRRCAHSVLAGECADSLETFSNVCRCLVWRKERDTGRRGFAAAAEGLVFVSCVALLLTQLGDGVEQMLGAGVPVVGGLLLFAIVVRGYHREWARVG